MARGKRFLSEHYRARAGKIASAPTYVFCEPTLSVTPDDSSASTVVAKEVHVGAMVVTDGAGGAGGKVGRCRAARARLSSLALGCHRGVSALGKIATML